MYLSFICHICPRIWIGFKRSSSLVKVSIPTGCRLAVAIRDLTKAIHLLSFHLVSVVKGDSVRESLAYSTDEGFW